MIKIFVSIMLLLAHGYTIEYNHVPMAESGYFACYDADGDCVGDDLKLSNFVVIAEIELAD